jgi:DNA-binding MarR family transcriptional regulator
MTIREDLKQNKPFAAPSQEAAVALLHTADLVRRSVAAIVEPHGITPQQYNVLRILRGAGASGLPTLDIVERMVEETPGITRLIDRLESKKLVVRKRCKTDRRQVFCCITERGLALLDGLDEPLHAAEKAALGALSEKQLGQLLSLLDKARTGLNAALVARRSDPIQEDL